MVTNKKAQVFLLAAVIIVAVITSLGITTNRLTTTEEPKDFYDFSYEVNRETGAVMDYELYNGFSDGVNLTNFTDLLIEDIKEKDPSINFVVIYGNNASGIEVINKQTGPIMVGGGEVGGGSESTNSMVCIGHGHSLCTEIESSIDEFDHSKGRLKIDAGDLIGQDIISLNISGHAINFSVSQHKQVLFIMQKDVGYESFISTR